jgi:hypothetical protein
MSAERAAAPPSHATTSDSLLDFMRDDLAAGGDVPDGVAALLERLRERYREALAAVVLYGSCRRKRDAHDGLVDLLVLVSGYRAAHGGFGAALANALLPPNVYYLEAETASGRVRCKYAVIRIDAFQRHCKGGLDGYFWARFTQPARLVWSIDANVATDVAAARADAARTFATRAAPLNDRSTDAITFWQRALTASYGCELRPESPAAAAALISSEPGYWQALTARLAASVPGMHIESGSFRHAHSAARRLQSKAGWAARRVWSKTLNVTRLFKAAGTFTNGIDYLLWKAERHSGVRVVATERMRRYPRRSALRLAWRLWRQGAFR